MNTKAKELNDFQASLLEGVKYAQGKKAKVKIENIFIRPVGEDIKKPAGF